MFSFLNRICPVVKICKLAAFSVGWEHHIDSVVINEGFVLANIRKPANLVDLEIHDPKIDFMTSILLIG